MVAEGSASRGDGYSTVSSGTRASRVVSDSYMAMGSLPGKSSVRTLEEQGVAGDQATVDQKALAPRGVARVWTRVTGTWPTWTRHRCGG